MLNWGIQKAFDFPKPKTKNELDFSFSGLKTAILYFIQKKEKENPDFIKENLNDICASIQSTIIDILLIKTSKGSKENWHHKRLQLPEVFLQIQGLEKH